MRPNDKKTSSYQKLEIDFLGCTGFSNIQLHILQLLNFQIWTQPLEFSVLILRPKKIFRHYIEELGLIRKQS